MVQRSEVHIVHTSPKSRKRPPLVSLRIVTRGMKSLGIILPTLLVCLTHWRVFPSVVLVIPLTRRLEVPMPKSGSCARKNTPRPVYV